MDPEGIYGGKGDAGLPPKAHLREPGQRVSAVNGIEHTAPDDGLTLPPDLDRTKGNGPHTWRAVRRCDHCGQPATPANALKPYHWPGRPDGIRLHRRCEEPWHDAHHPRGGGPATAHKHVSQRALWDVGGSIPADKQSS
jgi:hypothetical protein